MESQSRGQESNKARLFGFLKSANRVATYGYLGAAGLIFGTLIGLASAFNVFVTAIIGLGIGLFLAKLEVKLSEEKKSDFQRAIYLAVVITISLVGTLCLLSAGEN